MSSRYSELLHYRRAVSDIYHTVRTSTLSPHATWLAWRQTRDQLFCQHPQTPLNAEQLGSFAGLPYYDYDPTYRFAVTVDTAVEQTVIGMETASEDGTVRAKRFGQVTLPLEPEPVTLSLYWILGYGGGVFLPFRDATNRDTTYGGGRYLLDTIKHADLGETADGKLILDFNYAYNPSCAYNHFWSCPLAPPENWLDLPIPTGEQCL